MFYKITQQKKWFGSSYDFTNIKFIIVKCLKKLTQVKKWFVRTYDFTNIKFIFVK